MPQKKNPDLTELIRGKSGRLLGAADTLSTLIKGLPLAYNKDLQEGQEPVFDAADTIAGILRVLPEFTASLRFRFDRMKTAAETGYLNAMAAATYLTHKGVPFRKAHEKIGNAVRLGLETGRELQRSNARRVSRVRRPSSARTSSPRSRSRPRWTAMMLSAAQRVSGSCCLGRCPAQDCRRGRKAICDNSLRSVFLCPVFSDGRE